MKKRCPSCGSQVVLKPLLRRKVRCESCGKSLVVENKALELAAIVIAAILAWSLPAERMAWWALALSFLAIGAVVGWIGLLMTPLVTESVEGEAPSDGSAR